MPRYPASYRVSYSIGPGPLSPAVKALVWTNAGMFLLGLVVPSIVPYLGLIPAAVVRRFFLWQPVTYMFLHAGLFHLLFNMLALWMFGTELERKWGTRFFVRYYAVGGVGAAATTIVLSLLPLPFAGALYLSLTVGACCWPMRCTSRTARSTCTCSSRFRRSTSSSLSARLPCWPRLAAPAASRTPRISAACFSDMRTSRAGGAIRWPR